MSTEANQEVQQKRKGRFNKDLAEKTEQQT